MPTRLSPRLPRCLGARSTLPLSRAELPQQLLRPLVEHRRQHEPHLDDQIAALGRRAATARRGRATGSAGPTACPAEPQPRRAVERRHSIRAPSAASWTATGTVRYRSSPVAPEQRMRRRRAMRDVEVAGRSAARPRCRVRGTRCARRRRCRPARGRSPTSAARLPPSPPHAAARLRPLPPGAAAAPAGSVNTMCPRAERTRASPCSAGHTPAAVARARLPAHVATASPAA